MGFMSSRYEESSQKSRVDASTLTVEKDAIQVLIAAIQRKKEVEVNSSIVKNQSELLKIAQERYQRGYLPLQESEKIAVDLSNAQASLIDSKMNENEARANLENLLGHSNIATDWPWLSQLKNSKSLDRVKQSQEVSLRPDWKAAQDQVQFLDYKSKQNWGLLFPSLDASFGYGYYSGIGSPPNWERPFPQPFPSSIASRTIREPKNSLTCVLLLKTNSSKCAEPPRQNGTPRGVIMTLRLNLLSHVRKP